MPTVAAACAKDCSFCYLYTYQVLQSTPFEAPRPKKMMSRRHLVSSYDKNIQIVSLPQTCLLLLCYLHVTSYGVVNVDDYGRRVGFTIKWRNVVCVRNTFSL